MPDSLSTEAAIFADADLRGDTPHAPLAATEILRLPFQKRVVVQYAAGDAGGRELRLYYGDKEISFDEPELFPFGEALARQTRFEAGAAATWGPGYAWERIRDLLESLVEEGILLRGDDAPPDDAAPAERARPAPLPPGPCPHPRVWDEAEGVTGDLAGRAVETGWLELMVPIFRVAHPFLDGDGRQIGEANVFPRGLRLDIPTQWLLCIYPGTRYMADAPMNVTALRAMREHWPQMMAALHRIRTAFFGRYPEARDAPAVGHIERLATAVLAVPSWQLLRCDAPVANGALHPALSSMFRVTDGLRMVMHQMLFVPFGEPARAPTDAVSAADIHEYAERNYSFFSGTGVCAGPRVMIEEFLGVLVEGRKADVFAAVALDPEMECALADVERAIDYGLLGLQAYAVTFSLWPLMTRTYESLAKIVGDAVANGAAGVDELHGALAKHVDDLHNSPYLAREAHRKARDHVYADMYENCGRGLLAFRPVASLPELIAPSPLPAAFVETLEELVRARAGAIDARDLRLFCDAVADFVARTQAILREATATQELINGHLSRPAPTRPFTAADMDVHNLMQGAETRRLPYLLDELERLLGVRFSIDSRHACIAPR